MPESRHEYLLFHCFTLENDIYLFILCENSYDINSNYQDTLGKSLNLSWPQFPYWRRTFQLETPGFRVR